MVHVKDVAETLVGLEQEMPPTVTVGKGLAMKLLPLMVTDFVADTGPFGALRLVTAGRGL